MNNTDILPAPPVLLVDLSEDISKLAPRIQNWLKNTVAKADIPRESLVQVQACLAKSERSPLSDLPEDIKVELFKTLDVVSATIMQLLNRKWRAIYKMNHCYKAVFGAEHPFPLSLKNNVSGQAGGRLFMLLRTEMWRQAKLRWDPWKQKFVGQEDMMDRIEWVKEMPQRERDERIKNKRETRKLETLETLEEERDDRNQQREDAREELNDRRIDRESMKVDLLEGARQDIYARGYDADEEGEAIEELEEEMLAEFEVESLELVNNSDYRAKLELADESIEDGDIEVLTSCHSSDSDISTFPFAGADHRNMQDWVWP